MDSQDIADDAALLSQHQQRQLELQREEGELQREAGELQRQLEAMRMSSATADATSTEESGSERPKRARDVESDGSDFPGFSLAPARAPAPAAAAAPRLCPRCNAHPLLLIHGPPDYYEDGVVFCDVCNREGGFDPHHCRVCEYDECPDCWGLGGGALDAPFPEGAAPGASAGEEALPVLETGESQPPPKKKTPPSCASCSSAQRLFGSTLCDTSTGKCSYPSVFCEACVLGLLRSMGPRTGGKGGFKCVSGECEAMMRPDVLIRVIHASRDDEYMAEARAERPGPLLRRIGDEEEARLFSRTPPLAAPLPSISAQPAVRPVGAKLCPTCGAFITHAMGDGCHWVTCDFCSASFCFGCVGSDDDCQCADECSIFCCLGCTSDFVSLLTPKQQVARKAVLDKADSDFDAALKLEASEAASRGLLHVDKEYCKLLVCEPSGNELATFVDRNALLEPALLELLEWNSMQYDGDLDVSFTATTLDRKTIAIIPSSTGASLNLGEAIVSIAATRACDECSRTGIVDFDSEKLIPSGWEQCDFCGKSSCCSNMAGCVACSTHACDKCFSGGALGKSAHSDAGLFILRLRHCCCDDCSKAVCSDCVADGQANLLDGFKECVLCGIIALEVCDCEGASVFGELESLCKACAIASGYYGEGDEFDGPAM